LFAEIQSLLIVSGRTQTILEYINKPPYVEHRVVIYLFWLFAQFITLLGNVIKWTNKIKSSIRELEVYHWLLFL